jgi:hypothetical protein
MCRADPRASGPHFPAGTEYVITNVDNGKVLDDHDCSTSNGAEVDTWASLSNTCRQWASTSLGNGRYTITDEAGGKVLDSVGCGTGDGTLTGLWWA